MARIDNGKQCSGCHACYSVCPVQCIHMEKNEEGFLYPKVDESKCIQCGLCKKVCESYPDVDSVKQPKAYAAYAMDADIRMQSSSGGMFYFLAKHILENGGIVCGATICSEDGIVKHIFVDDLKDIQKLMTSKYVQSEMGNCYKKVKEYLESGRRVFFTGTPCQVNGLKKYLGKEYDSLLCQDIICHGVPSSKIWKIYLSYLSKKQKGEVVFSNKISFRDKTDGWINFSMRIPFSNGKYRRNYYSDPYLRAFIHNLFLRPSCYACKSKGLSRSADITLADFWGVKECYPEMYDAKGVSLVLTYTSKGQALFDEIKADICFKEVDWEIATKKNPSFYHSVEKPEVRERIYEMINNRNFENVVNKYTDNTVVARVIKKVKRYISK